MIAKWRNDVKAYMRGISEKDLFQKGFVLNYPKGRGYREICSPSPQGGRSKPAASEHPEPLKRWNKYQGGMNMGWRSKDILQAPEWSLVRGLYKAMGYSDYDLSRPLIGIANSWNRVVPGHYNLRLVSDYVKQGIFQAGGTPIEFGVIAACDGIAQGHDGMHYILPTRDLIANDVEMMIGAHRLDGVVLLEC
jgi:hypothetical protein